MAFRINSHWTIAFLCAVGCLGARITFAQPSDGDESSEAQPDVTVIVESTDGQTDLPPVEQAVLDAAASYVEVYNNHDVDAIVDAYTPQADIVTVEGDRISGREAIRETVLRRFEETPNAKLSLAIDSIRMITDDVAVEEGEGIFFGDGESVTSRSLYSIIHVFDGERWRMAHVRNIKDQPLAAASQLEALDWLVGDWIDEGADALIENHCRWSDDRSFLLNEYEVIRDGEVVLKGSQRIGWDPQANLIRSWAFDEGGAFNEATWTNAGDHWVVRTSGVGADGTAGSMTRTFRPDGPDRYFLSITDRNFGGESLPDIEVTLVRKPPAPQSAAE